MRCPAVLSYLRLGLCALQVREERLAEEKIKKRAAARKMEEAEARRRQEEEARRQRALQQVCVGLLCPTGRTGQGPRLPWALGIHPRGVSLPRGDGDLGQVRGFWCCPLEPAPVR